MLMKLSATAHCSPDQVLCHDYCLREHVGERVTQNCTFSFRCEKVLQLYCNFRWKLSWCFQMWVNFQNCLSKKIEFLLWGNRPSKVLRHIIRLLQQLNFSPYFLWFCTLCFIEEWQQSKKGVLIWYWTLSPRSSCFPQGVHTKIAGMPGKVVEEHASRQYNMKYHIKLQDFQHDSERPECIFSPSNLGRYLKTNPTEKDIKWEGLQ